MKEKETKKKLILAEEPNPDLVREVVSKGYADNLNEDEVEAVGFDPFLIAHALVDRNHRVVVSAENSASSKQRANRKVPDVCASLGVDCLGKFALTQHLEFATDWKPVAE